MKLFSPQKARELHSEKMGVDIVQIAYLENTLNRIQAQINTESSRFDELLRKQRSIFFEEKTSLQAELSQIRASTESLREERARLMIPIDSLKKEVEQMHEDAQARLKEIDLKENEINVKIELLTEKLDQVSERESRVEIVEQELRLKQKGIEDERSQIQAGHKRLNEMMVAFNKLVEEKTADLKNREEINRIAKQRADEYLATRSQEIIIKERELEDKRKAFEREFNRLKNKNGRQK